MKKEKTDGCVYFVRHKGLKPIKIGYSSDPNPKGRVDTLKTLSPYGIEFLGFIRSENAKKLETDLHKAFQMFRVKGEWFEISESVVSDLIIKNYNIEQKEEFLSVQEFYLDYIEKKESYKKLIDNDNHFDLIMKIKQNENIYTKDIKTNKSHKSFFIDLKKYCNENSISIEKGRDIKGRFFKLTKI